MTLQEHIDIIMDYFDFEIVHKAMTVLDWKWAIGEEMKVPEIPELRSALRKLIKHTWELAHERQETTWAGTGGFEVIVNRDKDGENIAARFVLEEFESNPDLMDNFQLNK